MMEQVALSGVEPGQRCRVEEIGLSGPLARRLMDLGLMEGTEAVCRLPGALGGSGGL